jgi:hypothetical protein
LTYSIGVDLTLSSCRSNARSGVSSPKRRIPRSYTLTPSKKNSIGVLSPRFILCPYYLSMLVALSTRWDLNPSDRLWVTTDFSPRGMVWSGANCLSRLVEFQIHSARMAPPGRRIAVYAALFAAGSVVACPAVGLGSLFQASDAPPKANTFIQCDSEKNSTRGLWQRTALSQIQFHSAIYCLCRGVVVYMASPPAER